MMPPIKDTDVISRSVSTVAADIADESILMDVNSGYFFQLNVSASQIWKLVEQPKSFGDLCAEMQAKYAVPADACRADLAEFARDLAERGVLTVEPR